MARFRVMYIDGHDLKYKHFDTKAESPEEAIRKMWDSYTDGDFDHRVIEVSELPDWSNEYWGNDKELRRGLDSEEGYDVCQIMGRYEIIFSIDGQRRCCFVNAVSMDEALGNFFRHHTGVTYDMIVDHIEI